MAITSYLQLIAIAIHSYVKTFIEFNSLMLRTVIALKCFFFQEIIEFR